MVHSLATSPNDLLIVGALFLFFAVAATLTGQVWLKYGVVVYRDKEPGRFRRWTTMYYLAGISCFGYYLYLIVRHVSAAPVPTPLVRQYRPSLGVEDFNFSWQLCALFGFLYTLLTIYLLVQSDKLRPDFSNIRSLPAILMVHIVFLAILIGVMQIGAYIAPFLPSGMIEPSQSPGRFHGISILDFLFFLSLPILSIVEQGWLYRYLSAPEAGPSSTSVNEREIEGRRGA